MSESSRASIGSIGWADLTVEDADAVKSFYKEVVGWQTSDLDMGGYSDYCMNEPSTGKPVVGICHARGENASLPPQWLIYVTVEDLEKSISKCVELGGEIIAGPRAYGNQGRYCVFRDPSGAVAALYEMNR
jgi:hypothetical protein